MGKCNSKSVYEPEQLPPLQIEDDTRKSVASPLPKSPLRYEEMLKKSGAKVNPKSPVFTNDFYDCFTYFDKDGNGKIDGTEIREMILELAEDFYVKEEEIMELVSKAEIEEGSEIDIKQFAIFINILREEFKGIIPWW